MKPLSRWAGVLRCGLFVLAVGMAIDVVMARQPGQMVPLPAQNETTIAPAVTAVELPAELSAKRSAAHRMRPLWEVGVGVASLRLPDYRGSDESRNWLLPLPFVVYRGEWLRADRDGARAVLLDTRAVEIDLSVSASVPTRSRDNAARAGMPDLKPALEAGPNLNVRLFDSGDRRGRLELRLPLRAAFTVERSPRSAGATFAPHLNLDLQDLAGGWDLGLLSGPVFSDRRYHQRVYGVDAAFATPTRAAYQAGSGYSGWQSLAAVSRRFEQVWVGAFLRHDSLRGATFAHSPLVRRDSAWTMGLGVSWVLRSSTELVAAQE